MSQVRDTSLAAYDSLNNLASEIALIVEAVRRAGPTGLIRREISDKLGMDISSVSGRVAEELAKDNHPGEQKSALFELADTRKSSKGRPGHILVHRDYAPEGQMPLFGQEAAA